MLKQAERRDISETIGLTKLSCGIRYLNLVGSRSAQVDPYVGNFILIITTRLSFSLDLSIHFWLFLATFLQLCSEAWSVGGGGCRSGSLGLFDHANVELLFELVEYWHVNLGVDGRDDAALGHTTFKHHARGNAASDAHSEAHDGEAA